MTVLVRRPSLHSLNILTLSLSTMPSERLSKAGLEKLQAASNTPNKTAHDLEQVKGKVYAIAWSLSRVGKVGHQILLDERLSIAGPNDVRSLSDQITRSDSDDLIFWKAKLRCLEKHQGTIQIERVKGWVYTAMVGLGRMGKDGRSVLRTSGLCLQDGVVRCHTRSGEPEFGDRFAFWEERLRYLKNEHTSLQRPTANQAMYEFLSSDSEVEEDNAELALVEQHVYGWNDRMEGIAAWAETGAEALRPSRDDPNLRATSVEFEETATMKFGQCTNRKRPASNMNDDFDLGTKPKRQKRSKPSSASFSDVQPTPQIFEFPSTDGPEWAQKGQRDEPEITALPHGQSTTKCARSSTISGMVRASQRKRVVATDRVTAKAQRNELSSPGKPARARKRQRQTPLAEIGPRKTNPGRRAKQVISPAPRRSARLAALRLRNTV
ncbi:hypothetical protein CDEST_14411 [Colletotrichum destructivum]|uniref:Uncharacterized protein n=1 Tax=Colletotrichum destructivum TaxID=34406 RepID=A0AAX4J1U4_9PEZI|nr:hypothetical protein CDEST_14411 [Colletotrichum destructivum]